MIRIIFLTTFLFTFIVSSDNYAQPYRDYVKYKTEYIQLNGHLFLDVQLSKVYSDSKTFVDVIPLNNPEFILKLYDSEKTLPDFDLRQFVFSQFKLPEENLDTIRLSKDMSMNNHIEDLWNHLVRNPTQKMQHSTLLPLKYPYIVPGGRFREIYYWDSFFTILGLLADGKIETAENMVYNFSDLLDKYKMIPNGNRVYYLTRSQPPFFSLMVDIICRYKRDYNWGLQFIDQLQTEYSFWMNGIEILSNTRKELEHVVILNKDEILNRYYDFDSIPREESYKEDYQLSMELDNSLRPNFCRNLRAAAESGWDFSSRWFKDGKSLSTIQTTDILPVDLNSLLYFLEERLAFFYKLNGNQKESELFNEKATKRLELINKFFWDEEYGFYFDYNWRTGDKNKIFSLAACYPLYFGIAKPEYTEKIVKILQENFLEPGGLVSTTNNTGQQWDAPNGWAPLQWIAIKGLREYGFNSFADTIKQRWLHFNESVYKRTGKMLEKYNVEEISLFGGGGEYPLQDGFGWTNGVAAALISNFDRMFLIKKFVKQDELNK